MDSKHAKSRFAAALLLCLGIIGTPAWSVAADMNPAGVFVQEGVGDQKTQATVVGLTWDLPWEYGFRFGRLSAYAEVAIGRWHTAGPNGASAWPTQLSAIPNLRLYPSAAADWFIELGVGPTYIMPLFRTGHKRFSTEFNFDDHLAIGRRFGHSEVSLRAEHFSNAGIAQPNPGENFSELRYTYRF